MKWLYLLHPKTGHRVSVRDRDFGKKLPGSEGSYESLGYQIEYERDDPNEGSPDLGIGTPDAPGEIAPPPTEEEIKAQDKERAKIARDKAKEAAKEE